MPGEARCTRAKRDHQGHRVRRGLSSKTTRESFGARKYGEDGRRERERRREAREFSLNDGGSSLARSRTCECTSRASFPASRRESPACSFSEMSPRFLSLRAEIKDATGGIRGERARRHLTTFRRRSRVPSSRDRLYTFHSFRDIVVPGDTFVTR